MSANTHLFNASSFTVMGPTVFPKPSDAAGEESFPLLKSTFGKHRPKVDAVFTFACEYKFNTFITFVTSLRKTGFGGDIVIAISQLDLKEKGVMEFLKNQPGVVTYVIDLTCFNAELEETFSAKGGMRVCQIHSLWGQKKEQDIVPINDPREPRTIATTRYELYWIWSLQYTQQSWIMLSDARDVWFQTNPFASLPRVSPIPLKTKQGGNLYFFAENVDATRVGLSPSNRKWLEHAYGDAVMTALEDKPTICSGSTMGEQGAIEAYIRAVVAEADFTGTKLMGADQGFHNYLYYSNKLANADAIHSITVFDQGWGIINNIGAMRTKELNQWGHVEILEKIVDDENIPSFKILNWNGQPSPVVHQYDRFKELSKFVNRVMAVQFTADYFDDINQRVRARAEKS